MKKHIQIWNRPKDSEIPNKLDWAKTLINEILDTEIELENKRLDKISATSALETMQVMEIKQIKVDSLYSFPHGYDSRSWKSGTMNEPLIETIYKKAKLHSENILSNATAQHELNKIAIQNNIEIKEGIVKMMEKFGIKTTYTTYEYKSRRSRTQTAVTLSAGFVGDIHRVIPTSDGFTAIEKNHNRFIEQIERWKSDELKKVAAAKQLEEMAERNKEKERRLMKLIVKYNLPATSTSSDVLDYILSKDKYLYLAYYMEKNRGDWSDGYYYAEEGLSNFTVETELDQKIYDDVKSEIDNWDGDGRCFRDCEYSYDVIFGYVNPELLSDYHDVCIL